ncbi:MAG: DoxX family protein [Bacteroidota bacterium]
MENYNWIIQVLLAVFFTMPGLTKIKTAKEVLVARGNMPPNGSISFIRFLGVSEILGVLAMIVPIWLKELQPVTALAATGFSIVMIAALAVHYKKKEFKKVPILILALVLSVFVAINNF